MYNSIESIYKVTCLRTDNALLIESPKMPGEKFPGESSVKQGNNLSSTVCHIFIIDLAIEFEQLRRYSDT